MTRDRTKVVRWAAFALAALVHVVWIRSIVQASDPEDVLRRDWVAFQGAGRLLLHGRIDEIYTRVYDGGYFIFHPPFALYPCALLGATSSIYVGYGLTLGLSVLSLAGAFALLRRLLPARPETHTTIAAFTLSSAAWVGVFVTGQVSAFLVLVFAAGGLAWIRGWSFRAGMLLALLGAKPNLALPLLGLAALSGRLRLLFGFLVGLAALVASTLPLGLGAWNGWLSAMRERGGSIAAEESLLWMQPTLFAFWHAWLPDLAAWIVWGAVSILFFGVLVRTWRARRRPGDIPRLISATLLFLVACNPHVLFYDGLLLLLPAAVWSIQRERYASVGAWRACGALLAAVYFVQHLSLFWLLDRTPPLIGLLVAAWLVVELRDLARAPVVFRPMT